MCFPVPHATQCRMLQFSGPTDMEHTWPLCRLLIVVQLLTVVCKLMGPGHTLQLQLDHHSLFTPHPTRPAAHASAPLQWSLTCRAACSCCSCCLTSCACAGSVQVCASSTGAYMPSSSSLLKADQLYTWSAGRTAEVALLRTPESSSLWREDTRNNRASDSMRSTEKSANRLASLNDGRRYANWSYT